MNSSDMIENGEQQEVMALDVDKVFNFDMVIKLERLMGEAMVNAPGMDQIIGDVLNEYRMNMMKVKVGDKASSMLAKELVEAGMDSEAAKEMAGQILETIFDRYMRGEEGRMAWTFVDLER